jgi:hypothetical protein
MASIWFLFSSVYLLSALSLVITGFAGILDRRQPGILRRYIPACSIASMYAAILIGMLHAGFLIRERGQMAFGPETIYFVCVGLAILLPFCLLITKLRARPAGALTVGTICLISYGRACFEVVAGA